MSIFQYFEYKKSISQQPRIIYDIGAWKGHWSTQVKSILPNSQFYMFEANTCHRNDLQKTGLPFFDGTVLSSPEKKSVTYYTGGSRTGDSYYKEMTDAYSDEECVKVQCKTLDQMIYEHDLPFPDFIKIDTQGSELDILSGASFLDKVNEIYCECPFLRYNTGAPNLQEYLDFFTDKNFIPINILETHYLGDALLQIDVLFKRK